MKSDTRTTLDNAIDTQNPILVTAANGNTGLLAAKELLLLGFKVRAMVRNKNAIGAVELTKLGAEIFVGDMNDIRDLRLALKGVKRAYFCAPFDGNSLFKTIAFIVAAEEEKLEHVVYMTQWLASEAHHSMVTKSHWLGDQIVKMHQHVNYTFVNPGLFGFVYFLTAETVAQLGLMPTVVKGATTGKVGLNAPPSEEDQGRVIAHILKNPTPHIGKTYRPTGPKEISLLEVANIFEKVLGRSVKIKEISEDMFLKASKSGGWPTFEYCNVRYYMKEFENNAFSFGGSVTSVVKDITGREPEDFETIARREFGRRAETSRTLSNKLSAIFHLVKMLLTPTPDMTTFEQSIDMPRFINGMKFVGSDENWKATHL
ncbi:MAG: NmrA family transcriptional regulator [Moraxellaceae bacterium]|nr:MAG: NmrA family transcriptional regulator [Moraxellaceae bacterium]